MLVVDGRVAAVFFWQEVNCGPHVLLRDAIRAQAVGDVIERQARVLVVLVVVLGKKREYYKSLKLRTMPIMRTYVPSLPIATIRKVLKKNSSVEYLEKPVASCFFLYHWGV
jgi:hypothetical protein